MPTPWKMADGTTLACRDKLAVLAENHAELKQTMQDAFEDAVLMGLDEAAYRAALVALVEDLRTPHRAA
jgi:hypothetical protein